MADHNSSEVISSPPIAPAITAWARVLMNRVKFIHNNSIFYSDTDSIVLQKPLNPYLLGNNIGPFKQEYPLIKNTLFISPKLYFLELDNGKFISKGKGYSGKLTKFDYLQLYNDNIIEVVDIRWGRNLELSTLSIKDQIIKISPSSSKRNKLQTS